jgi:uncharacterized membrane protein YsdA (DUF1294 family)
VLVISLLTFFAYRGDKRRAEEGDDRTPEAALHLAEMLGGWPAAFVAQRVFRHKIAKVSYQVKFWLIVMAHEYLAIDGGLLGWRFTREMFHAVRARFAP